MGSPTNSQVVVKSSDRTVAVLEHLAFTGDSVSLHDLHGALGIPKSSLHGLLRTLQSRGWVEVDESTTRFRLGVRALLVGTSYIDHDRTVSMTRGVLDQAAEETGETVHLARLDRDEVVYLATRESRHELRLYSRVGRRLPAHATALGKALLAARSDEEVLATLQPPLTSFTPNTLSAVGELKEELARTRDRGFAIDREESTRGLNCFALALPTATPPVDAISISVPVARLSQAREAHLIEVLQRMGEDIALRCR